MKNSFIDLLYYIFIYNLKILKPFFIFQLFTKILLKKNYKYFKFVLKINYFKTKFWQNYFISKVVKHIFQVVNYIFALKNK